MIFFLLQLHLGDVLYLSFCKKENKILFFLRCNLPTEKCSKFTGQWVSTSAYPYEMHIPLLQKAVLNPFPGKPFHLSQGKLFCYHHSLDLTALEHLMKSGSRYSCVCINHELKAPKQSYDRGQPTVRGSNSPSVLHDACLKSFLWNLVGIPECLSEIRYSINIWVELHIKCGIVETMTSPNVGNSDRRVILQAGISHPSHMISIFLSHVLEISLHYNHAYIHSVNHESQTLDLEKTWARPRQCFV